MFTLGSSAHSGFLSCVSNTQQPRLARWRAAYGASRHRASRHGIAPQRGSLAQRLRSLRGWGRCGCVCMRPPAPCAIAGTAGPLAHLHASRLHNSKSTARAPRTTFLACLLPVRPTCRRACNATSTPPRARRSFRLRNGRCHPLTDRESLGGSAPSLHHRDAPCSHLVPVEPFTIVRYYRVSVRFQAHACAGSGPYATQHPSSACSVCKPAANARILIPAVPQAHSAARCVMLGSRLFVGIQPHASAAVRTSSACSICKPAVNADMLVSAVPRPTALRAACCSVITFPLSIPWSQASRCWYPCPPLSSHLNL